jgi:hypothetical protein
MAMYKNGGYASPSMSMSKMPATSNSMSCVKKIPQPDVFKMPKTTDIDKMPKSILKSSRSADSADEALVDALRQLQSANAALEAAVNMQATDLRRQATELELLRHENAELRLRERTKAILEVSNKAISGVLAQKAESAARMALPDQPPPSYYEMANQEVAVQACSILVDAGMQTEPEKGKKGASRRSQESVTNTSAHVAEAFRLGWLAGAGAKKAGSAHESNSTRSEIPSDVDALSVTHSDGNSTGGYSAATTPPSVATPPGQERSPSRGSLDADVDLITGESD